MGIRWKIMVGLTACQLVSLGCHRAEIDLSELTPKAGKAGSNDAAHGGSGGSGAGGASDAGGDPSEINGGSGASGEPDDTSPPRVLSTSPSDGERGVLPDSKIVVRFSEPMNRVPTAGAVEFGALPVSAEWNELGTELSLTPLEELKHARGADPASVEAIAYSLGVSRLATDVAGNPLEADHDATFFTSREISTRLPYVDTLMGYVVDSDNLRDSSVGADPLVGDWSDVSVKGFITYDLGKLRKDTQRVTSATLTAEQYEVTGDPYQMGSMMLEHVAFSALEFVLSAPTRTSFGALFTDAATKVASLDVTSAVRTAFAEGAENAENAENADRVQFRFAFTQAANLNGVTDDVRLLPLSLEVWYLAP
jgi:hypothetical protein